MRSVLVSTATSDSSIAVRLAVTRSWGGGSLGTRANQGSESTYQIKNLLAVVEAIARQTASSSTYVADYVARLSSRNSRTVDTHDLIADEDWKGARLDDLAACQLAPFADADQQRASYSGPPVMLRPAAVQNIGLALHELGTNAPMARYPVRTAGYNFLAGHTRPALDLLAGRRGTAVDVSHA
jgi:HWE histidine kinase